MRSIVLILFISCISSCVFVSAERPSHVGNNKQDAPQGFMVPCYFANWGQYRQGGYDFIASDVNPALCTHIMYAFYIVRDSLLFSTEWNDEEEIGVLVGYKEQYPDLKVMLAVGGWNAGSEEFSDMVQTPNTRKMFIDSCIIMLRRLNLDGIDINWQYPTLRGGRPSDKQLYTVLLQEMREAFDAEDSDWLISSTQSAGEEKILFSYEIEDIAREVDFINLLTYEFHGPWDPRLGIHSNLYGAGSDNFKLNADWAIEAYTVNGSAPADKLVFGISSLGKSFRLCESSLTQPGNFSCGEGAQGPITGVQGTLSYYEICQYKLDGWTSVYDTARVGEYSYSETDWVGYDTVQSIATKLEKRAVTRKKSRDLLFMDKSAPLHAFFSEYKDIHHVSSPQTLTVFRDHPSTKTRIQWLPAVRNSQNLAYTHWIHNAQKQYMKNLEVFNAPLIPI